MSNRKRKTTDERERDILQFWKENNVFEQSLEQTKDADPFVFFEGPPTANGTPGLHHVLSRTFKDLFCRYHTMNGHFVLRKGGWDTHGLPVEVEVEKELGLSNKQEVEEYGIAAFNAKCKESVWQYKEEWEELTDRMGFWIDLDDPYITYEPRYVETVWWIIRQIHERGLLEKGLRVVPWCPRCGTSLSSHEVAQGYETVEDPAVTVKMPLKDEDASLLVWTTTPWTLLANVAVAVHPDLEYVQIARDNGDVIVAEAVAEQLFDDPDIVATISGSDLVGREYEPSYRAGDEAQFPHRVVAADYVSAEDGTGLVHIAPFGEEDMAVIQENSIPTTIPVGEDGHVLDMDGIDQFAGQFVKKADNNIIEDLNNRGLLVRHETIEHEYPFCWRCDTPLLYYPHESWFIRMSELRDRLLSNNDQITWEPEHIKDGRFGEWLRDVKDWNLSRERYWGTPLPVWECDSCDNHRVVGGVRDLPEDARNTFYVMRHGHTKHNDAGTIMGPDREKEDPPGLTQEAQKELRGKVAAQLEEQNIDRIITSPYRRTRETADVIADVLDVPVTEDDRLGEIDIGVWQNKLSTWGEYRDKFTGSLRSYIETVPEGGESRLQTQARMVQAVLDINARHDGETILLVSHGAPLAYLRTAMKGYSYDEMQNHTRLGGLETGEWCALPIRNLPVDDDGMLDLHRPFVDDLTLPCTCGGVMQRVEHVIDTWFDSGSMPYAQWHYPFEDDGVESPDGVRQFPADFIAEGVDQTRGWFYTLLAISTLLEDGPAYTASISLGLVMDEEGKKMSKSRGNTIDPWKLFEEYGADATRLTLVTMSPAGAFKRFSEREVQDRQRRVLGTLRNVARFYAMYRADDDHDHNDDVDADHVLDRWMLHRLSATTTTVREKLDAWDATGAGRALEDLIDDCSNWYVRRSRTRFQQPDNDDDHRTASFVLRHTLHTITRLLAPLTPFVAEELFQQVRTDDDPVSVHLASFPDADDGAIDEALARAMEKARAVASEALRIRSQEGIKVRQPLAAVEHPHGLPGDIEAILLDEINVKESRHGDTVVLETDLTPELRAEGNARELARSVQSLRKQADYSIDDRITVGLTDELRDIVGDALSIVEDVVKADAIVDYDAEDWDATQETTIDDATGSIGVKR